MALALSKLGASKGGKARAESLSAAKRVIAKKAAKARAGLDLHFSIGWSVGMGYLLSLLKVRYDHRANASEWSVA